MEGIDLLSMKEDQIRITGSLNGRGEGQEGQSPGPVALT